MRISLTQMCLSSTLTMLILKIAGELNVSFWIIFSPLLILIGAVIFVVASTLILSVALYFYKKWKRKRK